MSDGSHRVNRAASSRNAAELAWELFDGWKLAAEHAMGYSASTNARIEAWIEAKRLEVGSAFGARRPTETQGNTDA